jgi:hypothetical protein
LSSYFERVSLIIRKNGRYSTPSSLCRRGGLRYLAEADRLPGLPGPVVCRGPAPARFALLCTCRRLTRPQPAQSGTYTTLQGIKSERAGQGAKWFTLNWLSTSDHSGAFSVDYRPGRPGRGRRGMGERGTTSPRSTTASDRIAGMTRAGEAGRSGRDPFPRSLITADTPGR